MCEKTNYHRNVLHLDRWDEYYSTLFHSNKEIRHAYDTLTGCKAWMSMESAKNILVFIWNIGKADKLSYKKGQLRYDFVTDQAYIWWEVSQMVERFGLKDWKLTYNKQDLLV